MMSASLEVDVRDMICSQALAVVAKAALRLSSGDRLIALINTEDVRRDLEAWASRLGHHVEPMERNAIHILLRA